LKKESTQNDFIFFLLPEQIITALFLSLVNDGLPWTDGGQSSPRNPHAGISGGGLS